MDENVIEYLAWRSDRLAAVGGSPLDLQRKLDNLPADEFVVVWMYGIECHTFNVIAGSLGISTSTAHARWRRALKRMEADGGDESRGTVAAGR